MARSLARRAIPRFGRLLGGRPPRAARELAAARPSAGEITALDAGSCLLLVTHRRDGMPVPTPLWFARDGRRVLVRTSAESPKVARARRDPGVLAAPCDHRGRPLGPALRVAVRLLDARNDAAERARADALITARYGLRGRVWGALLRYARLETAYLELTAVDPITGA